MTPSLQACPEMRDPDTDADHAAPCCEGTATGRCAGSDNGVAPAENLNLRPTRCGCALCAYYDPERAYCLYVDTPVTILFACPRFLDL
ncbi:hypothetical protein ABH15_08125 [Methanoculleus taiwanensis]|uniref:DUF2769 domain-containing protein n=1 Tax=Methanoculleus taiwanensis TaxID=1550565 RepID=A0A498H187_9EURY|nr:hypothetical protein ABH15_08125 [Methanoculleus taiwanensis]